MSSTSTDWASTGGRVAHDRDAQVGEIGGQPAALASHGDDLYVALHIHEVKRSTDRGRTWVVRVAP